MKVAVTGASGFIGRQVVADLAARGAVVVTLRRPFAPAALAEALRDATAIVHLAGLVSAVREPEYFTANVDCTRTVAEAARTAGVRMVHISSLAAAGPAAASAPRSEDDAPNPITAYGRSKLESERVLAGLRDLRWIALRPGVVYGPGDRAMLPLFRMAGWGVLPLVGRPTAAYSVIHITDCIRAITSAITSEVVGEAIFVAHPRPATVRDLVESVAAAVGARTRIVPVPMPVTRVAAIVGDLIGGLRGRRALINSRRYTELAAEGFACRVDRLRDRLGVVAQIDLRDGLGRTAEWYRAEGWIT